MTSALRCFALSIVAASLTAHGTAFAQSTPPPEQTAPATKHASFDPERSTDATRAAVPEHLGLEFQSADGRFAINPWLRTQVRFSDPFDNDPLSVDEFDNAPGAELELRRARLKIEGHVFDPRIGFYFEHELSGDHPLLDLRLDIKYREDLQLRLGQYKVLYNRERIDSSGKQQFAERSVATYAFTLDRQRGITLARHWAKGTPAANWLMLGIHEGDGRGSGPRGEQAMYVARWQWQFLGRELAFSQSDLKSRDTPAATLAFAGATVRGPYTRFSSSGGGQLDGFEQGKDDRYTLRQGMEEFAWHYAGMSVQQELHIKKIIDHETSQNSTLVGGYAQFGKAWRFQLLGKERVWELALRVARVDWETPFPDRVQDELTAAANLFLTGHDHKFTAEVSRVALDEEFAPSRDDMRYRVQWDVSF
jgi:phosphate-selective porin OprO and OprP